MDSVATIFKVRKVKVGRAPLKTRFFKLCASAICYLLLNIVLIQCKYSSYLINSISKTKTYSKDLTLLFGDIVLEIFFGDIVLQILKQFRRNFVSDHEILYMYMTPISQLKHAKH